MDSSSLKEAKAKIFKDMGPIIDLPVEMQNTIANLYYKEALLRKNPEEFYLEEGNRPENSWFIVSSLNHIPGIVADYRKMKRSKEVSRKNLEYIEEIFLLMFRYRIPNVPHNPYFISVIKKFFYRAKYLEHEFLYLDLDTVEEAIGSTYKKPELEFDLWEEANHSVYTQLGNLIPGVHEYIHNQLDNFTGGGDELLSLLNSLIAEVSAIGAKKGLQLKDSQAKTMIQDAVTSKKYKNWIYIHRIYYREIKR